MARFARSFLVIGAVSLFGLGGGACAGGGDGGGSGFAIERVSVSSEGAEGNAGTEAEGTAISGDGRFVVFSSEATNLVAIDVNGYADLFLRDRDQGTTEILTLASGGGPSDGNATMPAISADGQRVAFRNAALNLGGAAFSPGVLVLDRVTGAYEVGTVGTEGESLMFSVTEYPALSADGNTVTFSSNDTNLVPGHSGNAYDVFLRDLVLGSTLCPSSPGPLLADGDSLRSSLSADGRYLAFDSYATNLVGSDTNDRQDIFLFDRVTRAVTRISLAYDGSQSNSFATSPALSADGRIVAFDSLATNLVPEPEEDGLSEYDIFVRDLDTGTVERVSVDDAGEPEAGPSSLNPTISADGRFVAFASEATNLAGEAGGGNNIFVRDRDRGRTVLLSRARGGGPADGPSFDPHISADGRWVVFESEATNLVSGDGNLSSDVFVARNPLAD